MLVFFLGKPLQPILMSPRGEHLKGASVALPANFRLDWMENNLAYSENSYLRILTGLLHFGPEHNNTSLFVFIFNKNIFHLFHL